MTRPAKRPQPSACVMRTGWRALLRAGIAFGLAMGALFAFLVAAMPNPDGTHYWWEIMLPGSIVGLIVGYVTQRYGRTPLVA